MYTCMCRERERESTLLGPAAKLDLPGDRAAAVVALARAVDWLPQAARRLMMLLIILIYGNTGNNNNVYTYMYV